jgi:MFS family permease
VVIATLLIVGTTFWGVRFSFGVFFKSIEAEFDWSRAATSGVFSAYMVVSSVVVIAAGWAVDRYGPRIIVLLMSLFTGLSLLLTSQISSPWQLFITYSLLLSIGTGAMHVVLTSTVSRWFEKKRGFALGIASSGAGLGMVVMSPFAAYLISGFGWRMAYIVMGLVAWLIAIPLSRLLRRDPYEIGTLPDGASSITKETGLPEPTIKDNSVPPPGLSLREAFRTSNFWILSFIWVLTAFTHFFVLTHIVPHATDIGVSPEEAAALLGLIGGVGIVGRVLVGRVSDRIGSKAVAIGSSLVIVGAMVWLIWARDFWALYLFAIVYGFAFGGRATAISVLVVDAFGVSSIGVILGLMDIGWGAGGAIGSAIGGLIFDVTDSYVIAFEAGAVAMLIATLLIATVKTKRRNF